MAINDKFIDLAEQGAGLSVKLDQLVIRHNDGESQVPIEELAALIVSHPAVHYTHAVLSGICSTGGVVVICDEKRLPVGMLFPLQGHSIQAERMAAQVEVSLPTKKQIWKQIVKAKIREQGRLLVHRTGADHGLFALAKKVRSGDPSNLEALAARKYWPFLFDTSFSRIPRARDPVNSLLNYGYAVLRAMVARALCSSGLHPSLGVHHHNRYNPFCLADDIIEPFRPIVDLAAIRAIEESGPELELGPKSKAKLIGGIARARLKSKGESRHLFDILAAVSSSLSEIYCGRKKMLSFPDIIYEKEQTDSF